VDLRSAYDRVNRQTLIELIRKKEILNKDQTQLLQFLLRNCTTKYGDYETGLTNGVPQGSTLAPVLFNIFVETLSDNLRETGMQFQFYADDIVVLADDDTVRKAISTIESWANRNNM
jgi:RNA-directed DNA polymerase